MTARTKPLGLIAWRRRLLEYGLTFADWIEVGGTERRVEWRKLADELLGDRKLILGKLERLERLDKKKEQPTPDRLEELMVADRIKAVLEGDNPDIGWEGYSHHNLPQIVAGRLGDLRQRISELEEVVQGAEVPQKESND